MEELLHVSIIQRSLLVVGVQFLETATQGLTIVTGDPHALDPDADDVVNHALEKPIVNEHFMVRIDPTYQDSLLILDNAHQWNDTFGGEWYQKAMIGIGFIWPSATPVCSAV